MVELESHKICWETVRGGITTELVFVYSSRNWNIDHEGFIGRVINRDAVTPQMGAFLRFGFDGLLYANRIKPEKVIELLGEDLVALKNRRAKALMEIWETDFEVWEIQQAEEDYNQGYGDAMLRNACDEWKKDNSHYMKGWKAGEAAKAAKKAENRDEI
jgi:hypothetical protein